VNSKQEKDEETSSLKNAKEKKRNAPIEDLDAEALKSCDVACGSPGICVDDEKWGLIDRSDSKHDSEANF